MLDEIGPEPICLLVVEAAGGFGSRSDVKGSSKSADGTQRLEATCVKGSVRPILAVEGRRIFRFQPRSLQARSWPRRFCNGL